MVISNYSAYSRDKGGKERYFEGEENGKKFKIICPNCKASGKDLEHKNWYLSKENGEDLIISCKKCGYEINTETEDKNKCEVIV